MCKFITNDNLITLIAIIIKCILLILSILKILFYIIKKAIILLLYYLGIQFETSIKSEILEKQITTNTIIKEDELKKIESKFLKKQITTNTIIKSHESLLIEKLENIKMKISSKQKEDERLKKEKMDELKKIELEESYFRRGLSLYPIPYDYIQDNYDDIKTQRHLDIIINHMTFLYSNNSEYLCQIFNIFGLLLRKKNPDDIIFKLCTQAINNRKNIENYYGRGEIGPKYFRGFILGLIEVKQAISKEANTSERKAIQS